MSDFSSSLLKGRPLWISRASLPMQVINVATRRRLVLRVYRLYGWGRGDYQKEGRGVSGVSWQVHIFNIGHSLTTFTIWSIDSCQNRIATDQYPMTISQAHVSTHRGDVIYLEAVR